MELTVAEHPRQGAIAACSCGTKCFDPGPLASTLIAWGCPIPDLSLSPSCQTQEGLHEGLGGEIPAFS